VKLFLRVHGAFKAHLKPVTARKDQSCIDHASIMHVYFVVIVCFSNERINAVFDGVGK
jgi:hypothetical protein